MKELKVTCPNQLPEFKNPKFVPEITSSLKKELVMVPESIYRASGIKILGTRIKSLLFTTDVAVIKNSNAQAVMAVYPFTPQLSIIQAILSVSAVPVFVGVGGGLTTGIRTLNIALQAELMGAYGVVVNSPMDNDMIRKLDDILDIPVIATVVTDKDDIEGKVKAGARIINISGGKNTSKIIKHAREILGPEFPIIATGGPKEETIQETIEAGANSVTYTPPSSADLFRNKMEIYRKNMENKNE
ncbi:MAG: hydrolase [Tissierellia bacterium]|nr:hydrolase [Tissierellia bacterium]